jgi:hypothetical protein
MTARVDHAVSSGTFSLDGQTFDVENNIWVIGDDTECVVIDAPHSVADILAVIGGRKVRAIMCTHAHDDHVRVAPALRERVAAPILLHPDDRPATGTHPRRPARRRRPPLGRRPVRLPGAGQRSHQQHRAAQGRLQQFHRQPAAARRGLAKEDSCHKLSARAGCPPIDHRGTASRSFRT